MAEAHSVTRVLKKIANPKIKLHRGEGYWYFTYGETDSDVFETRSVMVNALSHLSLESWVEEARALEASVAANQNKSNEGETTMTETLRDRLAEDADHPYVQKHLDKTVKFEGLPTSLEASVYPKNFLVKYKNVRKIWITEDDYVVCLNESPRSGNSYPVFKKRT